MIPTFKILTEIQDRTLWTGEDRTCKTIHTSWTLQTLNMAVLLFLQCFFCNVDFFTFHSDSQRSWHSSISNNFSLLLRDRDQDRHSSVNCAQHYGGAWWHNSCTHSQPTGLSTSTKTSGTKFITWYKGGPRGNGWYSWAEALYVLVPSVANTMMIDEVKTEISKEINEVRTELETLIAHDGPVVIIRRKEVGNPIDFFDKTFAEYQAGFEANGEI